MHYIWWWGWWWTLHYGSSKNYFNYFGNFLPRFMTSGWPKVFFSYNLLLVYLGNCKFIVAIYHKSNMAAKMTVWSNLILVYRCIGGKQMKPFATNPTWLLWSKFVILYWKHKSNMAALSVGGMDLEMPSEEVTSSRGYDLRPSTRRADTTTMVQTSF